MNIEYIIDKVEGKEKPIIYVFDREGRKRKVRIIDNFRPYFYVKKEEKEKALELGLEVEEGNYRDLFGNELVKVYTNLPTDVPKLREKFSETWEADVLFVNRWLIDEYKEEGEKEWRICFLDIECDDEGFPDFNNPVNPIYSISVYDNYTQKFATFIWKPGSGKGFSDKRIEDYEFERDGKKMNVRIFWYDKEEFMLADFVKFVRDLDFDILTGWNVNRFDFMYLIARMEKLKLNYKLLSPLNDVLVDNKWKEVRIKGRTIIDLLEVYRSLQTQEKKSYNLSYIANLELGMTKIYNNLSEKGVVRNLWLNSPYELIKYNVWDVYLVVELDKKLEMFKFLDERRKIVGCKWDELLISSLVIDFLFLKFGKENNIILPTKKWHREVSYEGAIVFNPVPGLHKNVACMDFKSLYPSIIMTFNISPETITDNNDGVVLGNGVKFRADKRGLVPLLFNNLMELRKKYKKERDKYPKGSAEYDIWDRKQTVTKFLINSIYGNLGYAGSRLFKLECAESVTYIEREIISKVGELVKKFGYVLLYGDTDSVFVKKDEKTSLEEFKELNRKLNEEIKKWILESGHFGKVNKDWYVIELELNDIYGSIFFTTAKKRYVGNLIWSDGKYLDKSVMKMTGFEVKRSDTSDLGEEMQKNIFKIILEGGSEKEIIEYVNKVIEKVKKGLVSYEYIAIPKGVRKDLKGYKVNNPIVRAVNYSNKYLGTNFQPGDKVKLLWIKSVKGRYPPTDVIAFIDGQYIPDEFVVDWDKMIEVNIINKLRNLMEGFPINLNFLNYGNKSLGEYL